MSETAYPGSAGTCGRCGGPLYCIPGWTHKCPMDEKPPTEMTSLKQIKDKLDEIRGALLLPDGLFSYRRAVIEKLDAIAESQGKLYAALDDLTSLATGLGAQMSGGFDGIAQELGELRSQIANLRPPLEYPIAKQAGNKVFLFWPDEMLTLVRKPPSKRAAKRRRKP